MPGLASILSMYLFLIGEWSLSSVVLVSAIHRQGSVTGGHMSPALRAPTPPLRVVRSWAEAPVFAAAPHYCLFDTCWRACVPQLGTSCPPLPRCVHRCVVLSCICIPPLQTASSGLSFWTPYTCIDIQCLFSSLWFTALYNRLWVHPPH